MYYNKISPLESKMNNAIMIYVIHIDVEQGLTSTSGITLASLKFIDC